MRPSRQGIAPATTFGEGFGQFDPARLEMSGPPQQIGALGIVGVRLFGGGESGSDLGFGHDAGLLRVLARGGKAGQVVCRAYIWGERFDYGRE